MWHFPSRMGEENCKKRVNLNEPAVETGKAEEATNIFDIIWDFSLNYSLHLLWRHFLIFFPRSYNTRKRQLKSQRYISRCPQQDRALSTELIYAKGAIDA